MLPPYRITPRTETGIDDRGKTHELEAHALTGPGVELVRFGTDGLLWLEGEAARLNDLAAARRRRERDGD